MSAVNYMGGRYDHKMDPKFRVSVPVDWRPAPGETLKLLATTSYGLPVVAVLTEQDFQSRLDVIDESDKTPLKKRQLKGMLHSRCRPATVNPQGKLLVPKDMSEKAALPADDVVTLVGRGEYFEIWSAANFARVEDVEQEEHADDNAELGVF